MSNVTDSSGRPTSVMYRDLRVSGILASFLVSAYRLQPYCGHMNRWHLKWVQKSIRSAIWHILTVNTSIDIAAASPSRESDLLAYAAATSANTNSVNSIVDIFNTCTFVKWQVMVICETFRQLCCIFLIYLANLARTFKCSSTLILWNLWHVHVKTTRTKIWFLSSWVGSAPCCVCVCVCVCAVCACLWPGEIFYDISNRPQWCFWDDER